MCDSREPLHHSRVEDFLQARNTAFILIYSIHVLGLAQKLGHKNDLNLGEHRLGQQ